MITITQLKEQLEKEHKRDIKLTIIRNLLIIGIIIIVLALIYHFAFSKAVLQLKGVHDFFDPVHNPSANIYRIITLFMFVMGIGYFIFDIVKLIKRPAKIEEFISKIEEGKVASQIERTIVYKIIIPLGKIKIQLAPISFATVRFSKEFKPYKLPLSEAYIPDMKTLLSGVKTEDVRKAWYELYDGKEEFYDGETTSTSETSVLNSTEEFRSFVNNELAEEINNIESKRKKGKSNYIIYLAFIIVLVGGWMLFSYLNSTGKIEITPQITMYGFIGFFAVFYAVFYLVKIRPAKNKPMEESFELQFKTKVFNRLVQYINPKFRYIMHGHINLDEFLEMGFFEKKFYGISGNDQILGKHSGVPFQICDFNATRNRNFSAENDSDNVFSGQVFIAKFNKSLKSDVYLIPKKVDGGLFSSSDTSYHLDHLGEKIVLEDPEFMKMFDVYSPNQLDARYVMSTSLMQRIKDMAKAKPKSKFMFSFRNNRISIADNSNTNNFEVSMFQSITKNDQVVEFYEALCSQLKMIDDLKLNINIWKTN